MQRLVTVGLICALIVIGGALRLYQLEGLPPRLASDEYTNALDVFMIRHGGGPRLFGLDWKPMPALTAYATAAITRVTGPTIFALRALSIGLTLLAGVLLFVVLRWSCSTAVAWAAALALLSNPWFLNFSRSGWENAHVAAYWMLFTWCFFHALASPAADRAAPGGADNQAAAARDGLPPATAHPYLWATGAGAALALSCYGYFTGRLLIVVWALFLPLARAATGASWSRIARVYGVVAVTAALLFAPQVPEMLRNWEYFQRRVQNVSVLASDPAQRGYPPGTGHATMIAAQLGGTVRYLLIGDAIGKLHYSPTHRPPFHPILVPLLLIGLVAAALRWRVGAWWWLLLLVPLVATQGLSLDVPDLARLVGAAVAFFWFVGFGAERLGRALPARAHVFAGAGLAAGALALAGLEWRAFAAWMAEPGVTVARGSGVDHREYDAWRAVQERRIAAGERTIPVVEWERPEVREALLQGGDAAP